MKVLNYQRVTVIFINRTYIPSYQNAPPSYSEIVWIRTFF